MKYDISGEQWRIMQVLWEKGKTMTSSEIVEGVKDERERSPRTVKTILQRLVSKGLVGFMIDSADSRVHHYYPKVSEDECIQKENQDFVSRYYKGDVGGMLARFIGDSKLSCEQIEELAALLEAKREETP